MQREGQKRHVQQHREVLSEADILAQTGSKRGFISASSSVVPNPRDWDWLPAVPSAAPCRRCAPPALPLSPFLASPLSATTAWLISAAGCPHVLGPNRQRLWRPMRGSFLFTKDLEKAITYHVVGLAAYLWVLEFCFVIVWLLPCLRPLAPGSTYDRKVLS